MKSPRPVRDVKQMCDLAILNLAACHAELKPGATVHDFLREVMEMVAKYDCPSVVNPIEIVMQFLTPDLQEKGVDWVTAQPFGPILISAAHCNRALASLKSGLRDLAWANTADAMYWSGVANTGKGVDALIYKSMAVVRAEGEAQAMSENAKSGATVELHRKLTHHPHKFASESDPRW
ncbi:hypothetical protein GM658_26580 [Pseudoduganella eburnea]|uniref:Uncharacterized protein n=1 Tax=Massilia eburnea TaxID=1776165 RepID=A0A6L6QQM1_9BURK|nr:hypothetical protein [Massilia eburnea]MTW14187.1 hypothetical protein [Massilia eburnea]